MPLTTRILISSSIWIICGLIVMAARGLLLQTASSLAWEIIGMVMSGYGIFRLFLHYRRSNADESEA